MKSSVARAVGALAFGGLFALAPVSSAYAMHGSTWLVGVLAIVTKDGAVVDRVRTNAKGEAVLRDLVPGDYEIAIDGESFVAAMDEAGPPPRNDSGGGASLNIGGGFGGSHHRSSDDDGAGPQGHDGHGHDHGSHSGGVGLGVNIPLGGEHGDDPDAPAGYPITGITISLPTNPDALRMSGTDMVPAYRSFTINTAYCRDAAIRGTKIHATIGKGGGSLVMSIFDRWGNL